MSLVNATGTGQALIVGFVESSTALQTEAARIESAVEVCQRNLQVTIPTLIKTVGELKAALVQTQSQNCDLNITCRSEIQALEGKKSQLLASIEQEKKKIADLQIKLGQLQQQINNLNSPSGLASAHQQESIRVVNLLKAAGVI